ncbi:MAG: hypothetical protein GYB33_15420 [Gammaproteobacteria bacterium]|nr:hypothetical protein [Gammaproteobacteria bacterium]
MTKGESKVFDSRAEACTEVTRLLADQGLDPALAGDIAARVIDEFQTRDRPDGFRIQVNRWVIKDEDLDLFDKLSPAAITAATAAADPSSAPALAAAVATAISSVIFIARKLLSHSIVLSTEQYEVLIALKSYRAGADIEQIAEAMLQRNTGQPQSLEQHIQQVLDELATIRVRAGETRTLVNRDQTGKWHAITT